MKNGRLLFTGLALTAGMAMALPAQAGQPYGQNSQAGQSQQSSGMQGEKQQNSQAQLRGAEDIKGMQVQDKQGKEVGTVDMLVVDPAQGKMAYVILSPASGAEQLIVPWNAVQMPSSGQAEAQQGQSVLILDVPQEQLEKAPKGGLQAAADQDQGRRIHQFYGVSPYWEEGSSSGQQMQQAPELPPGHPPVLPEDHPPVLPPDHPPITPSQQ